MSGSMRRAPWRYAAFRGRELLGLGTTSEDARADAASWLVEHEGVRIEPIDEATAAQLDALSEEHGMGIRVPDDLAKE